MHAATAIILARAGSKGVPGKNTAPLAGLPCIAYTIEHALASAHVARVAVSSDDPAALDCARQMGCEAIERPSHLATDTARVDDAARHAALALHGPDAAEHNAPLVILYANVPIRPPDLTDRALDLLARTSCHSVQSYAPVGKHHPWWTSRLDADARVRPWEGDVLNHAVFRRQDLPPAYVPDGGVIALAPAALFERVGAPPGPHAFFGTDRRGVINPEGAVIDIDSPTDLLVAESRLREARTTEITEDAERNNTSRISSQPLATPTQSRNTSVPLHDGDLTGQIIAGAIEVHRALGPGLLESVYEACLAAELEAAGLRVQRQAALDVRYHDTTVRAGLRLDLLVNGTVIVEIKSVDALAPIHDAQLLTYLKLSGRRTGLLLNFNVPVLKQGLRRLVL